MWSYRHASFSNCLMFKNENSFADTKEGRYNPKMDPIIPVQSWRKGSQVWPMGLKYEF